MISGDMIRAFNKFSYRLSDKHLLPSFGEW